MEADLSGQLFLRWQCLAILVSVIRSSSQIMRTWKLHTCLLAGHMTHVDDTHLQLEMYAYGVVYDLSHMHTLQTVECATVQPPPVVNCGIHLTAFWLPRITAAWNPLRFHASKTKAPSLICTSGCRCQIDATVLPSVVNNRNKLRLRKCLGSLLYVLLSTVGAVEFCAWVAVLFCIVDNVCLFRPRHRRVVMLILRVWRLFELICAYWVFEVGTDITWMSSQTDVIACEDAQDERDDDAQDCGYSHVWRRVDVTLGIVWQWTCVTEMYAAVNTGYKNHCIHDILYITLFTHTRRHTTLHCTFKPHYGESIIKRWVQWGIHAGPQYTLTYQG